MCRQTTLVALLKEPGKQSASVLFMVQGGGQGEALTIKAPGGLSRSLFAELSESNSNSICNYGSKKGKVIVKLRRG